MVRSERVGYVGGDKPHIGKPLSLLLHPHPAWVVGLPVPMHEHHLDMPRDIPIELLHDPLDVVHVTEESHLTKHHVAKYVVDADRVFFLRVGKPADTDEPEG